jgi:hypothetical protein
LRLCIHIITHAHTSPHKDVDSNVVVDVAVNSNSMVMFVVIVLMMVMVIMIVAVIVIRGDGDVMSDLKNALSSYIYRKSLTLPFPCAPFQR